MADEIPASQASGSTEQLMSAEQARELKELAKLAADPESFDETLTAGEAARRIVALQARLERERRGGVDRLPRT
jgi:hypothetical protein